MDIVLWLRSLGLGKYEAAFHENEIDETVLPSLTEEHLKQLGVTALGHRVKLLDAIAALRSDASGKTPSVDATTTSSSPTTSPEDRAERRQVTVMFSDLVGSTALSARMDPEDLREVISAYQKCVAETVQRFGGFVAKYMGDGVLIYFGYPQAHEDDAERAVRAGLELVAAVGALKTHAFLQTRLGIATGLVVVGDLIGSGVSQEQAIVGETPNLAARLQGVAGSNSVAIAESTRKLVGNLFELQDLGAQDLKGIAGPVRAWAALRPALVPLHRIWKKFNRELTRRAPPSIPFQQPSITSKQDYRIFPERGMLPVGWLDRDDIVVERFRPERFGDSHVLREWYFLGDREVCRCETSSDPISTYGEWCPSLDAPPPHSIRQAREDLRIDYGKIDYAIDGDGAPVQTWLPRYKATIGCNRKRTGASPGTKQMS